MEFYLILSEKCYLPQKKLNFLHLDSPRLRVFDGEARLFGISVYKERKLLP